ncbi:Plant-specific TFIIB-related protein 1 [Linum perenne]
MKCLYCSSPQGRCSTTSTGRSITECTSCGRVVEERQFQPHHLFHIRAQDNPLCLVTSDLPSVPHDHLHKQKTAEQGPSDADGEEEDPFEPTGFITAFSTWSLEPTPLSLRSSISFSGHLAELERVLELAIREAQEPRTLQEISIAANVPQKEIGKYIKILGEALQLSQPINSNSISVHMPRFCTLLQLNKSAQVIAYLAILIAVSVLV